VVSNPIKHLTFTLTLQSMLNVQSQKGEVELTCKMALFAEAPPVARTLDSAPVTVKSQGSNKHWCHSCIIKLFNYISFTNRCPKHCYIHLNVLWSLWTYRKHSYTVKLTETLLDKQMKPLISKDYIVRKCLFVSSLNLGKPSK